MDRECLSTAKSFCFHDTMPTTYKQNYNLSFLQKQINGTKLAVLEWQKAKKRVFFNDILSFLAKKLYICIPKN